VFAVIVTIMVLELKAPDEPAFSNVWPLWSTAISYMVSYLFIAIIWINYHHLMRFVDSPTLGLIWINFVHLFLVSLLPFATAWIASTRLASSPMAGVFVCIDVAYNVFEHQVFAGAEGGQVSPYLQRTADADRSSCLRVSQSPCWWRSSPPASGSASFAPRHKSMTTSPVGWEQQTSTLPSAGLSSGSGS